MKALCAQAERDNIQRTNGPLRQDAIFTQDATATRNRFPISLRRLRCIEVESPKGSMASETDPMDPDLWAYEKRARTNGHARVAGIDEAGRGPLAGPVVSAAVVLPPRFAVAGVTDSKQVTAKRRDTLFDAIYEGADSVGIGIVDAVEIDRINILQATRLSMAIAVENLYPQPEFLLIDGNFTIPTSLPQRPVIGGDRRSISIAAASIVAKVTRDRMMQQYHTDYPEFEFHKHKGYPTKQHRLALQEYGCCPIHRRSFKGVKDLRWTFQPYYRQRTLEEDGRFGYNPVGQ